MKKTYKTKDFKLKKGFLVKMTMGFYVLRRSHTDEQLDPKPQWTNDVKKAKVFKSERKAKEMITRFELKNAETFWTGTPEELIELRKALR